MTDNQIEQEIQAKGLTAPRITPERHTMQTYIGTKILNAKPMTRGDYNKLRGWTLPADENGEDEGYLTDNGAGHLQWQPKAVFEDAFDPCDAMDFGMAVAALKLGKRVARAGWNGKGMFVYLVPANSYPAQTGAAKAHFGDGAMVPYNAYMAIKNVNETVSTWVPSVNDCLAEDWQIVE